MTAGNCDFRTLLHLPEENFVEISSDDGSATPPANTVTSDRANKASQEVERNLEAEAEASAFRAHFARIIPKNLISDNIRHCIQHNGNQLLRMAAYSGASLSEMTMSDDLLPTWPGDQWNSDAESLHEVMQCRLAQHQNAQECDASIRDLIIRLGNERLKEATLLGLALDDLRIGPDLLPTWHSREAGGGNDADDESSSDDEDTVMEDHDTASSSRDVLTSETSFAQPGNASSVLPPRLRSAWSSDSESEASLSESDYDDEITLYNFLHEHPVIQEFEEDEEEPLRNIVHNVNVFGSEFEGKGVDFEVFLVENDSDIEELPEAELAIDGEGFEHHHNLVDEVEVELADHMICCVTSEEGTADAEDVPEELPDTAFTSTEDELPEEAVTPPAEEEPAGMETSDWILIN